MTDDYRSVIIITFTPVRDGAELHGKVIGNIFGNYVPFQCVVNYGLLHDKWVLMVSHPDLPFDAPEMWVEWSHCVAGNNDPDETKLLVTIFVDGRAPTMKVVA